METTIENLLHQLKALLNQRLPATPGGTASGPTRKYYNDMVQYIENAEVVSDCCEVSIYNTGTKTMIVNGITFLPNTGISFDGKEGERDTTKYSIRFTGAGQGVAFVIRKVYVS